MYSMKIIKRHKYFLFAVTLSFLTYVIFFGQFLTPHHYFFGAEGNINDPRTEYLPARSYLYDKIVHEHSFPFWTEKMFSGFPIYADLENAYLNPANVASILIFGPWLSYKILHLLAYLIGSLSFYFLLKRKGIGLLGYAVANVIFYFSTFFINHQIHYNVVMAFYLIPTTFLLADIFIEKRQLRYILLQSLVIANAVLWGHMQSAVIVAMGVFFYMMVFSFKKIRFSAFFFYFSALLFLIIIETLPQVLPTYELFSQGIRSSSLDYLKGTLSPPMAVLSFIPYLFGTHENYFGANIHSGLSLTEIYTYFGISSAILSVLALLFLKKSREIILAFVFIWIFLIFGFMGHNKIFPDNTPIITFFREWERTAVLSNFGIAILAGILIERLNKISYKNIPAGILFLLSPLVYIWILIKMEGKETNSDAYIYTSYDYIQNYPFFPIIKTIVLVLLGTFLVFFAIVKIFPRISSKALLVTKIIFVGAVFFDLIYFSKDMLDLRLNDISYYKIGSAPTELKNKRSILNSQSVIGMESLYYDNWSPFGCSQLKEKNYLNYYQKLGIKLRGMPASDIKLPNDYQNLKEAGVVAIAKNDGITYLNDGKLDLIKNSVDGYYIEKKEGRVVMQIKNPEDTMINTYLKYDPYWRVRVDGQKTKIKKDGIFFDFPLSKGDHLVEICYYPRSFYAAVIISLILGISAGFFWRVLIKKYQ